MRYCVMVFCLLDLQTRQPIYPLHNARLAVTAWLLLPYPSFTREHVRIGQVQHSEGLSLLWV